MDKSKRAEDLMKDPKRGLFKLAIPIMVGMIAHTLFNIVEIERCFFNGQSNKDFSPFIIFANGAHLFKI